MNPFPMQRPGVVGNPTAPLIADPHVPTASSHPTNNQWAALNTNPDLQRTLCKAAASGQLNPEQMVSFGQYIKGNPSVYKVFQIEVQAHQQELLHQQQQQQQQMGQDQMSPQHAHQSASGNTGFMPASLPSSQAPLQMAQQLNHYQQPQQSTGSAQQPMLQRPADHLGLMVSDPQVAQVLAQFRQAQEAWKNPNLEPAEREAAGLRARELRDVLAARMNHLGHRNQNLTNSPSPAPSAPAPQNYQPAGQTGQPQHPSEVQRAQLTAAYQRQQQMMSGMPLAPPSSGNIIRPISNSLAAPASSPRGNLNLSGRNSPAPNGNNSQSLMHSISRPSSSHQSIAGPASSPPAMHSASSPPNNSSVDMVKRRVVSRPAAGKKAAQAIGTPNSNAGSPLSQPINPGLSPRPATAAQLNPQAGQPAQSTQPGQAANANTANSGHQSSPPAFRATVSPAAPNDASPSPPVAPQAATTPASNARVSPPVQPVQSGAASQAAKPPAGPAPSHPTPQHTAIAAQQQLQPAPPITSAAPAASSAPANAGVMQPAREHVNTKPVSPVPTPFPPPRPTVTGGHAAPQTLAGSVVHRPPTNGMSDALGQTSGSSETARGQEATSTNRIVSKRKIQELVESIDPSERLESEVEDLLLELADEFIDSVTRFSCQLAKHRKSDRLETKDIQLHLERSWNIRIPGFANDEIRQSQSRRINALPSYQARVAAVREAAKKRRSGSTAT